MSGAETTPAGQIQGDSHAEGERPGEVCPQNPSPDRREAYARVIEPAAWDFYDRHKPNPIMAAEIAHETRPSLAKADQIIAMQAPAREVEVLREALTLASAALDELQERASTFSVSGVYFDEPVFKENVAALAKASAAEDAVNRALSQADAIAREGEA